MDKIDKLKKEAQEILAGRKASISIVKKIIFDKTIKQFSIKIPKEIASAAQLNNESEVQLMVKPTEEEIKEAQKSHFIIYGKKK